MDIRTFNDAIAAAVRVDRAAKGIAPALFALAKSENCESKADFYAKCSAAEAFIRSAEAGELQWTEDNLPRCWIQAKSDIAAGLARGLNPNEYPNYLAFKNAKVSMNKGNDPERPEREGESDTENGSKPQAVPNSGKDSTAPMSAVPEDLKDLTRYLAPLPELSRAKVVKAITAQAKTAYDTHLAGLNKGERDKAKATAAKATG